MSTNNTVPFNWDSENDNALFGNLFPDGLSAPNFGDSFLEKNSNFLRKRNALSYSPLSKNGDDVRNNFFGNSEVYKSKNIEVIVDPSTETNPLDKIKPIEGFFYWNTNNSNNFGDTVNGVADEYAFTVKLFVSKIAEEISKLYNNPTIVPAPKEILLFLEDNSGDFSSSTVYIKKGSDLKDLKFIESTMANNPRFANFIHKHNNISLDDLKELLLKDKVENVRLDVISAFFNVTSFLVSEPFLLKGVAHAIESVVNKIKETCLFEEKHWNPQKKEANTKFEPVLFPGSNGALDSVKDEEINAIATQMIASFEKQFKHYDAKILGILNSDMGVINVPILLPNVLFTKKIDVIPDRFEELLYQKYNRLRTHAYQMLEEIKNYDFSSVLKKSVNMLNAFFCGIWNGFVEAVCGIISLIQYLFEGAAFISDLLKNFKEKGPVFLEKIDGCILAFEKLDFGKIFANLASNVKEWATSESTTTLEEIAYYSGMFIGFVIELAVEIVGGILLTGGVLTVEAILTKIGQTFQALGKLVLGVMKLPVSLAGKTLTGFMQALHWLYEFLSKGTDELIRIIDEVFVKLKNLGEETVKNFNKLKAKAKSIFSKETNYDALYRDITKKFFINNKGVMSDAQFSKLATKIAEAFKVEMIIVDRNSEKFAELFARWEKNPIYAVFHDSTFRNGRYNIVLEGPAIYFFKGKINRNYVRETIEITSYTVQHELLHVKLWHKMVIEFPEMANLYRKIPRVLDELNVVGEMLKQNARKTAKWDIKDILIDLENINEKLEWRPFLKKHFGKEYVEIKDLENWDLGKYLNDL